MADAVQNVSHDALGGRASSLQPEDHRAVLRDSSRSCAVAGEDCGHPPPRSHPLAAGPARVGTKEAPWRCTAAAGLRTDRQLLHQARRPCLAHAQRTVSVGRPAPVTLQQVGGTERGSMLAAGDSRAQAARWEAGLLRALALASQVG